ncbi:hypothetical protein E0H73_35865 [Kribbella pittospori]|uniref:Uncharacterized protein n=1 Tax=Kribbella pittospori TaxID=722689 RepID=A0A4R0K7A3_9ACTN|nr:hypothetical protein [Kribbella pittospori]TCC55310.1 hypothetical protein E0H73_35865 [Kribbella pittospori]
MTRIVLPVSARLKRRVAVDFPAAGSAEEVVRLLANGADSERVQAAIVLAAQGDIRKIQWGIKEASIDWRDVLVSGGLADQDWAVILDRQLGPATG